VLPPEWIRKDYPSISQPLRLRHMSYHIFSLFSFFLSISPLPFYRTLLSPSPFLLFSLLSLLFLLHLAQQPISPHFSFNSPYTHTHPAVEEEPAHLFYKGNLIENMAQRLPERGFHLSLQHSPPTPEMVKKVDLVNEPDREL
jgi:hypothetical protein